MGICKCTGRSVLGLLGLLFWVSAVGLWVVSGLVIVSYQHFDQFLDSQYTLIPAVVLVVVGVVFFLAGILGCCAMCNQNRCVLGFFGVFLMLLVGLLVSAAVLTAVYRVKIEDSLQNETMGALNKYNGTDKSALDAQVEWFQKTLKCCGINNSTDWADTPWGEENPKYVPNSCCSKSNSTVCPESGIPTGKRDLYYQHGCYSKIYDILESNLTYIAGAAILLIVLLLLGLFCSCALMCIKRQDEQPYYSLTT